jgi:hypothetical protein
MKDEFLKIVKVKEKSRFDDKLQLYISSFKIYSEDLKDITSEKNLEIFNDPSDTIKIPGGLNKLKEKLMEYDYYSFNVYSTEEDFKNDLSQEKRSYQRNEKIDDLIKTLKGKQKVIFKEKNNVGKLDSGEKVNFINSYEVFDENLENITSLFKINMKPFRIRVTTSTNVLITSRETINEFFKKFNIEDKLEIMWTTKKERKGEVKEKHENI